MFEDVRSKKILLVSHCILNQNSVSDGTAEYPGINEIIIKKLLHANIGIIQLPCPEIMCLGLDRRDIRGGERQVVVENTRIRYELKKRDSIRIINDLVEQIMLQINEYIKNGFNILGIIGVNRSPSCGVNTTSENNQEVPGEGIFINILRKELEMKQIKINMIGIKGSETRKALEFIESLNVK